MSGNPFNPSTTINPDNFVGRSKEIDLYIQCVEESAVGNSSHIILMGEKGIGKSSLLRKFESVTDHAKHLVVRRDMDTSIDSLESLVNFLIRIIQDSVTQLSSGIQGIQDKIQAIVRDNKIEKNQTI